MAKKEKTGAKGKIQSSQELREVASVETTEYKKPEIGFHILGTDASDGGLKPHENTVFYMIEEILKA